MRKYLYSSILPILPFIGFFTFGTADVEVKPTEKAAKIVVVEKRKDITISDLHPRQKAEAFEHLIAGDCEWKGIKLFGKVQWVSSFPDIKVQKVSSFPDIKVQWVTSFPDKCGKWQEVSSFPDFKIQEVSSFPDIKYQEVTSFPGM